jgi:Ca2+-binding RTX toxin-like protein
MIGVKGIRASLGKPNETDRYEVNGLATASRRPAVLAALTGGVALYLKSFLPVWAETPAPPGPGRADTAVVANVPASAEAAAAVGAESDRAGVLSASESDNGPAGLPRSPSMPQVTGLWEDLVLTPGRGGPSFETPPLASNLNLPPPLPDRSRAPQPLVDPAGFQFPGLDLFNADPALDVLPAWILQPQPATDSALDDEESPAFDRNRAPANRGPVYLADVATSAVLLIGLSDLLRHTTDPDGDTLVVTQISASSGTILRVAGGFRYVPAPDHIGPVTLTMVISDGQASIRQTAYVTVTEAPVTGTEGDDILVGSVLADAIDGRAGDDNIVARSGDDLIEGGSGDDHILAGTGNDTVRGGAGDDLIFGAAGNDALSGGQGNDRLFGEDGEDILFGDEGDDALSGGAGSDLLAGGAGADSLAGDDGDDRLSGNEGADILSGGAGNDILSGDAGADSLAGGFGNDVLSGGTGDDRLAGDDADDWLSGDAGVDTLTGGAGNDTLSGDAGADSLAGGTGNDVLSGGAGADLLSGDAGDDRLDGGEGADTLTGGDGADTLLGEDGEDVLIAGAGADYLAGGAGNDRLSGNAGDDTLDGGTGHDLIDGNDGADLLAGGEGNDTLAGGTGQDRLLGGAADDRLAGGDGADHLEGGAGDDILEDGAGEDMVWAGIGDDIVVAQIDLSDDSYAGGEGHDQIDYSAAAEDLLIDMVSNIVSGLDIGSDSISGFESYIGGEGDDRFIASTDPVSLTGGQGTDVFDFSAGLNQGALFELAYQIMDFGVGDRVRVSRFDFFEDAVDEIGDGIEDIYEDRAELLAREDGRIRYRHDQTDDFERTLIEFDLDQDDSVEMTVALHGHHLLLLVEQA